MAMTETMGTFENIREKGRERLMVLSQPRKPKREWWTNPGPYAMWGTQDMLRPIPRSALSVDASGRLTELSTPKRNFQKGRDINRPLFYYSCGRASVILDVSTDAMSRETTQQLLDLAKPKALHQSYEDNGKQYLYSCGRSSPIWDVKKQAMLGPDRSLTTSLATPKSTHKDFLASRQIETIIPPAAITTNPSERIQELALPKKRPQGPFRSPEWNIGAAAKNSAATSRCLELARPKGVTEGYLPAREVEWQVPRAAKRASTTNRIHELSKPIIRASMDHVQFDPDAFIVKETALKGIVPRRVEELAVPIQR
ncbi:hypothetical protein ScPMuIL_000517 [Solemya velum]